MACCFRNSDQICTKFGTNKVTNSLRTLWHNFLNQLWKIKWRHDEPPSGKWQQPYISDAHSRRRRHSRTLLSMNDYVSAMFWQSLSLVCQLRRNFDDGRLSAEEHNRRHSQPLALAVYHCARLYENDLRLARCATLRMDCSRSCIRILALTFFLRAADE